MAKPELSWTESGRGEKRETGATRCDRVERIRTSMPVSVCALPCSVVPQFPVVGLCRLVQIEQGEVKCGIVGDSKGEIQTWTIFVSFVSVSTLSRRKSLARG
ncbi:unnamed protein product [Allacma fusca]|uniref:Uncharacterized protein n=1 Tax=Allacma fusca TaxID=39272 RepID=A0A8J2NNY8_9HEXA|nr:unnamed protein product [Allacma fusca]